MIEWLDQNFPIDKNYLVCQNHKEQLNSFLMERLVEPFHSGRKHNLWGEVAERLPLIGKKLGWVPNKMPAIFLTETVENEIADALAASENYLQSTHNHFKIARNLLSRFNLLNLAQRNPLFLSEGETKIIWFLIQWVKKPTYLIIGYLPSSLSVQKVKDVFNFLNTERKTSNPYPVIILGYHPDRTDWCGELFSLREWQVIPSLPQLRRTRI